MVGTDYRVATSAQLTGATPPKRTKEEKAARRERRRERRKRSKEREQQIAHDTEHGTDTDERPPLAPRPIDREQRRNRTIKSHDSAALARLTSTDDGEDSDSCVTGRLSRDRTPERRVRFEAPGDVVGSAGERGKLALNISAGGGGGSNLTMTELSDIYFKPVDLRTSRIEFGAAQGTASVSSMEDRGGDERRFGGSERVVLRSRDLGRLAVALARAPMVGTFVRRRWLEEDESMADKEESEALAEGMGSLDVGDDGEAPELTDGESVAASGSAGSESLRSRTPYSRANVRFLFQDCDAKTAKESDEIRMGNFSPGAVAKEPGASRSRYIQQNPSIVLLDPSIAGSPATFTSAHAVIREGECTSIQLPYGSSGDSWLHIDSESSKVDPDAPSRVVLRIAAQFYRDNGRKACVLLSDLDITSVVQDAAIAELAAESELDTSASSSLLHPEPPTRRLQATLDSLPHLHPDAATTATLDLLALISNLQAGHSSCMVVQQSSELPSHATGAPRALRLPWISQDLRREMEAWSEKTRCALREGIIEIVAKGCADAAHRGVEIRGTVSAGHGSRAVRCVGLTGDGGWVCFLEES